MSRAVDTYKATGDSMKDRLAFFHLIEKLKTQKRTGWINENIPDAESISDHMYRMSILALTTDDMKLDVSKCVMMAVVHDLAEAIVGDIAPSDNVPKEEKQRLEKEAMQTIVHDMLHDSPAAVKMFQLWTEYEAQESPEARFVKDLDRIEMALQADEYERRHQKSLQPFFDSSLPKLRHTEVRNWGEALGKERAARLEGS
ncbi:hypothetical protein DL93DRAFT_2220135 [Clavulina sp. PMI_390]|nr:hypothetical protein DL93DRAFT_2220135 [Clavulina sp. PMI_390]